MNVLILGSMNTVFLYSYANIFKKNKCNVFLANTSNEFTANDNGIDLYEEENSFKKNKFREYANLFKLDRINLFWNALEHIEYKKSLSLNTEEKLKRFILEKEIDIVFCFWGTTLKKESKSLVNINESLKKRIKIILCVNTYPVRYELPKELSNKKIKILKKDSIYFNRFDGIICSCEKMKDLFGNILKIKSKMYVSPDLLDDDFFYKKNICEYNKKSLIFLGNVNFSKRSIDDISYEILKLADEGISIWLQEPCHLEHENIHTFKPFNYKDISDGLLSEFIKRFSASLVIYNDLDNLRTSIGYPTRFALATLGQKTILIPSGVFDGIENYITDNNIESVIRFTEYSQIGCILDSIDNEKNCDLEKKFTATFNNHDIKMMDFIKSVL